MAKRNYKKKTSETSSSVKQEVYTDLEKEAPRWQFVNPNRKILIGTAVISDYDLQNNQKLAQILIEKGMGNLICLK